MTNQAKQAGAALRAARKQAGLSLREVARRAGTSHATLSAYERGGKSPTLETFFRVVDACDLALDLQFRPRIRYAPSSANAQSTAHVQSSARAQLPARGLSRGEELEAVLRLAAEFPARHAPELRGPVIAELLKAPRD